MRYQHISYLTVGLFVLAMLAALVAMLAYLTGRTGPTDRYYVVYANVAGLANGTPVAYQGFRVGRVGGIEPEHEQGKTRYRVALDLDRSASGPWPVPADSVARVVSPGLLSEVMIDIAEGSSKELLAPGAVMNGQEGANLFAAVDAIAGEVNQLSRQGLMPLIQNLDTRIDAIADSVQKGTPAIVGHLESSAAKLDQGVDQVLAQVRELAGRLNAGAEDLRQVVGQDNRASIAGMLKAMETAAANFRDLSQRLQSSQTVLHHTLEQSDAMVSGSRGDVEQAVKDLRTSLQLVSEHVGAIAYDLEATSRNMAEFSRQIRQSPGLLLSPGAHADEGR
jgi:phospholipid/cholesterol/gamma-HCH transport system substrate-binding protein